MTSRHFCRGAAASMMLFATAWATAHVALTPPEAAPGSRQTLSFHVTPGCPAGQQLSAVAIELPMRFRLSQAMPRAGWSLHQRETVHKNGPLGQPGAVYWSVSTSLSHNARDNAATLRFALQGRLPPQGGVLGFPVQQSCTGGHQVNARVQVRIREPAVALVQVSDAWMRTPAAGQRDSALYMALTASEHLRLVAAFSPAARLIEVHHTLFSKLKGMELFPAPAIDLPAGTAVRLRPGGVQLAILGLHEPVAEGSRFPVTLRFEDAAGVVSERTLDVPVRLLPPQQAGSK